MKALLLLVAAAVAAVSAHHRSRHDPEYRRAVKLDDDSKHKTRRKFPYTLNFNIEFPVPCRQCRDYERVGRGRRGRGRPFMTFTFNDITEADFASDIWQEAVERYGRRGVRDFIEGNVGEDVRFKSEELLGPRSLHSITTNLL